MSYIFSKIDPVAYDAWKTSAPEYNDPCDRCKLNSCDDCEYSEDYCKECKSTDCKCEKEDEDVVIETKVQD